MLRENPKSPYFFGPRWNVLFPALFGLGIVLALVFVIVLWASVRSDYRTELSLVRSQPVPFSHQHHVGGLGIDCVYCHSSGQRSAFAGMPAASVCMKCHEKIWPNSPLLEPVRRAYYEGAPLKWNRVNDLPDFVYFDHSIHNAAQIACAACHGDVTQMPLMSKAMAFHMNDCLACHRHPPPEARVVSQVNDDPYASPLTECYACHR